VAEVDTFKVGDLVVIAPYDRRGKITDVADFGYKVAPARGGHAQWWSPIELEHVDVITRLGRVSADDETV